MRSSPTAFVLMPFASEFDDIYEYLIKGALSDAGFNVVRADDIRNQRNILADVVQAIADSDLIVADLSTANPNVYYELGLAHAFGKSAILLTQDIDEIPFDLQSYRILTYATHFSRMNEARKELCVLVTSARQGDVQFGSPVSDFTALSGGDVGDKFLSLARRSTEIRDERGLLDFQAGAEDGFAEITSVMAEVGSRMENLNPEIQAAGEQLQSNINTTKKRSTVRSLALSLEKYAKWLQEGNARYRHALGSISESLNAMLSGEFEVKEDDKAVLKIFVSVMVDVEQHAQDGQKHIATLVATMDGMPRIEEEFNRAKRRVSDELKELIGNVDQTVSVLARARIAAARFLNDA